MKKAVCNKIIYTVIMANHNNYFLMNHFTHFATLSKQLCPQQLYGDKYRGNQMKHYRYFPLQFVLFIHKHVML